ncbi:VOC family protein [Agrococcus sp. ARC_14]|uniref:VOC family protein n=1 Tax=Agrococcus sp. ARC_14 TaxID=2919927 RepID=UPI001F06801C|nr:VOC family protein [Agrococcus sp. ARC_14]MCH1882018.1 VOC family protein [Agrococcus sp. ARC_14]
MTEMTLYAWFPGTTRAALTRYREVFGGQLELHTLADFGRTDGPGDAIAHGVLSGPVTLYASDAVGEQESIAMTGCSLALLGTAEPDTLTRWFDALAEGGTVIDPLQERPWGASDGRLVDAFGLQWLVGFEHAAG